MILNSIRNSGDWWYNLYNHCVEMSPHGTYFTDKEMKEALEPYGATYIYSPFKEENSKPVGHNIEFKRKEDMVMFILRYS